MGDQMRMDFGIDDLPLFSGTPVRVSVPGVQPHPQGLTAGQMGFFKCSACRDTGKVGDRFCLCEAGTDARLTERNES